MALNFLSSGINITGEFRYLVETNTFHNDFCIGTSFLWLKSKKMICTQSEPGMNDL